MDSRTHTQAHTCMLIFQDHTNIVSLNFFCNNLSLTLSLFFLLNLQTGSNIHTNNFNFVYVVSFSIPFVTGSFPTLLDIFIFSFLSATKSSKNWTFLANPSYLLSPATTGCGCCGCCRWTAGGGTADVSTGAGSGGGTGGCSG